ncbi:DUF937 domain-containing protein [soil metagenome]
MSDLDGLINSIPIDDIAKKLGVDPSVAKAAVAVAVPAIVGGLSANAQNADGAKSLETALGSHTGKSTDLSAIDTADGEKIVGHVFGAKKKEVVEAVAQKSGGVDLGPIVQQLLPILAPIVLAFLAQQLSGKKADSKPAAAPASTGGDIGSILGGLLSDPATQSVVGGLLGGLFGGKK